jgi:FkbM family methyltransferase
VQKIMWERAVTGLAAKLLKRDSDIIDVGANIGGVSHAFSQIVPDGNVIAIEANRKLIKKIKSRIVEYNLTNVRVLHRAAYNTNFRILTLHVDRSLYASSSSLYRIESNLSRQWVRTLTLDSLELNKLELIKIDVEGAEADVLLGATEIITSIKPWVIFEIEVPIRAKEVNSMTLLDQQGYSFLDVNKLEKIDFLALERNPGVFNLLAVPNNKFLEVVKESIQNLGLEEPIDLERGDYLFEIILSGEAECVQGIGIWNLDESNWEIYYETGISRLAHSANSCLPVYLGNDAKVEIRFGLECSHHHFIQARVQSLVFRIERA